MSTIQIEEMAAGEDESTVWVSLGFKSDISPFDVLFIVCGKSKDEQQIQHGMDKLYLERFDQGMSCYGGADSIRLGASEVTIHFTPVGTKRMHFPETVHFDVSAAAERSGSVSGNLKKMRAFPWGSIITDGECA
jgi:hypothetical protein